MYCPNCGQQQASGEIRFCSRCRFPMVGVAQLLASGGELSSFAIGNAGERLLSPRQKGLRRGTLLLFLGCLLTPIAAILNANLDFPVLFVPLFAILGIFGGLLRMLYAVMFEERHTGAGGLTASPSYMPPMAKSGGGSSATYEVPDARARGAALPPHASPAFSVADVRGVANSRPNTAEMAVPPPSVTENTTRLLKDPPDSLADEKP